MNYFKIGDIVKCVDFEYKNDCINIRKDDFCKVRKIEFDCGRYYLYLETLDGKLIEGGWYLYRFEKVESCKDNPFDYFEKIHIFRKNKSVELIKNGCSIKVYNDLTPEGGKRIELHSVITYHNDKCEIADEEMRKLIKCACEIYDMVFA